MSRFKGIAFGCDECGREIDTETHSRREAFSACKLQGWHFLSLDKQHNYQFCSEGCINKWLESRRK